MVSIDQHSRSAHVSRTLVEAHQWVSPEHRDTPDTELRGEQVSVVVFEMRMGRENIDAEPDSFSDPFFDLPFFAHPAKTNDEFPSVL
jgi:hypothetical protein